MPVRCALITRGACRRRKANNGSIGRTSTTAFGCSHSSLAERTRPTTRISFAPAFRTEWIGGSLTAVTTTPRRLSASRELRRKARCRSSAAPFNATCAHGDPLRDVRTRRLGVTATPQVKRCTRMPSATGASASAESTTLRICAGNGSHAERCNLTSTGCATNIRRRSFAGQPREYRASQRSGLEAALPERGNAAVRESVQHELALIASSLRAFF